MTAVKELTNSKKRPAGVETEWTSLLIASLITLLAAVQFTVYFSSLWPYLLQLDPNVSESFFGWVNAVYSLGQAAMCPILGYWSGRIGQSRLPILVAIVLMLVGNIIYLHCAITPIAPKWVMFTARFTTGLGAGVIAVLRTYSVNGSAPKDRSRAISLNMGAFAVGLTFGPAIQIIFTPLGFPGVEIIGGLRLNMYTAPAFMGVVMNIICATLVVTVFRESTVGIEKRIHTENASHSRFYALPSYDRLAVFVCICSRFAQMFVITNLETLGSPLSMTMFAWNKKESVEYNSWMHGGFGLIGLIMYTTDIVFDLGKKINHRTCTIIGLLALVVFHLLTFPWWGLPGKIEYQQKYITINGTQFENPEPVGCRPSFEWCDHVPPINMWLYVLSYVLINGPAFSLINVCMNTVFSKVIGPRDQGTLTGLLLLSGCAARICGPIFVSTLFQMYGPRPAWALEIFFAGGSALLWIIFYHRMVPLKIAEKHSAGESFKNKHGSVYKF